MSEASQQLAGNTAAVPMDLAIEGMTCAACARRATEAILTVPAVAGVDLDLESGRARVSWKPGLGAAEGEVLAAVGRVGFRAKRVGGVGGDSIRLSIGGMTCSGCARQVTAALLGVDGVAGADVQLEAGEAAVRWKPGCAGDPEALVRAVRRAGFTAAVMEPVEGAASVAPGGSWSPLAGWKFNVVAGTILTVPLLVLEWGAGVGMERWYHWLAFFLVLPIQTLGGARFYRGAWNQLRVGSANMDTLVSLGSTAAFLYSAWGLWSGAMGHLYFMESASIITLISVGHWIESKVSARAASALRALLDLAPPTARLMAEDGSDREVPVARLRPRDRILLKPGDRVPTDGLVSDGASAVDESMLTGESVPVDKAIGAPVYAGTLNREGRLVVAVTAIGSETALSHIIAVVQRAQNSRANIQKLGDRVSSVFVPVVVGIAILTGLGWGLAPGGMQAVSDALGGFLWPAHRVDGLLAAAIYHAVAVLIIACPCAMGLATPVAIMAGTNAAAARGILIRDGSALEKSGRLTAVIFDKTGTLTEGRVALAEERGCVEGLVEGVDPRAVASALASPSQHPLSVALVQALGVHGPPRLRDWREVRGAGVEGRLGSGAVPAQSLKLSLGPVLPAREPMKSGGADGSRRQPFNVGGRAVAEGLKAAGPASGPGSTGGGSLFRLGSLGWLKEAGVDFAVAADFIGRWSDQGATLLGLAMEKSPLAVFALRDTVKPAAAGVVRDLHAQGKRVYLVTGDNRRTAMAIAGQVGIPEGCVFAETRPEAKAGVVSRLQGEGERVAFVGDGINDAPALEQADLGIAVARASDVAREAADIILLQSDIQAVPEAIGLAQATLRTIRQNLFWAFFYNAAGIPLAMFGFLSPIVSAAAMGFSDLLVIGNALRLRRRGRAR